MKDKYSIALVGCGRIALKHIEAINFFHDRFCSLYLVDPVAEVHSIIKDELHSSLVDCCYSYSSLTELLEEHNIDIVVITTPPMSHYNLAHEALESGSSLIVEKPICLDYVQAYQLADLADNLNRLISVGYIYRFFPFMDIIKNDIHNGLLGELQSANIHMLWGHDQAYYDASHWRGSWSGEGGVLMNQTVHALDLISWLSGQKVSSVLNASIYQMKHRLEAEDTAEAELEYDGGMHSGLFVSTAVTDKDKDDSYKEIVFELKGSKGTIRLLRKNTKFYLRYSIKNRPFFSFFHISGLCLREIFCLGIRDFISKLKNPHIKIYEDFLQALDNDGELKIATKDAAEAVELVSAIYKSAKEQKRIDLPLKNFKLSDMEGYFET